MWKQPFQSRHRTWAALSIFVFLLSLYLLTAGQGLNSWDGEMLFDITWNLATRGAPDISCDSGVPGRDGRCFSSYELGMPLASVPLVWLAQAVNHVALHSDPVLAARVFVARFNQPVTALTGVVMFCCAYRLYGDALVGMVIALIYGVATLAWPYAGFHFREPLTALGLVSGSYCLLAYRQETNRRMLWWGGIALTLAMLTRLTAILCLPAAILYLEAKLREAEVDSRAVWSSRLAFYTPLLIGLTFAAYYNWYRFGSVIDVGYPDMAWTTSLPVGMYGLLLSPGKGLLWYVPVTIPALGGMVRLYHEHRREAYLFCACFGSFLLLYARFWAWGGGDCWGPRYLVPVVPFLVLALGTLVSDSTGVWVLPFVSIGILVQIFGVSIDFNKYIATVADEHLRLFNWSYSPLLHHARYLIQGVTGNLLGGELYALGLPPIAPLIWRLIWGTGLLVSGSSILILFQINQNGHRLDRDSLAQ